MFLKTCTLSFVTFGLVAGWSHSQTASVEAERELPSIIVRGASLERAQAFVKGVMPSGWAAAERGVPRWDTELCVSVIGPSVEHGQFIADRITQRAMDVDLDAGGPGCDPNLLIIVTNEPDALLPEMAKTQRGVFGFSGDANVDTGGSDISLAAFVADDRPVRWRQVIEYLGADGMPLDGDSRTDPLKFGQPPLANMPLVKGEASRLRSNVKRRLSRVVAVVDTNQTKGLSLGAISDYLAFVTLADVGADADLSAFPSILNLFNPDAEHPARMTDWDTAFLESLYSARLDAADGTMQYREIAKRMVRERKED
jgi:hypothetical protein